MLLDSDQREPSIPSRYVKLKLDALSLVLPQSEIPRLEPLSDVDIENDHHGVVGWIAAEGQQWPVYCLSKDLDAMQRIPPGRRICALVADEGQYFGLLCEEVQPLQCTEFKLWAMPECMRRSASPISALALHGAQVYCMSTAAHLTAYLASPT